MVSPEHPAPDVHGALLPLFGIEAPQRQQRIASAATAVTLPDSPAGRAATEWFDVMAHADSARLSDFISQRMVLAPDDKRPLGERVAQALSRRARLGPLVPVSFEAKSPTVLEVRCRTREGDPATATFEIEAAAPYRIVGVRMIVG